MKQSSFDIIQMRSSCRSYDGHTLSADDKSALENNIRESLSNPFGASVRLPLLENNKLAGYKLGTYGVIRGAQLFMAGIVKSGGMDIEGLGYSMEHAVLQATAMGLGTCWLAGTYNRSDFKEAAQFAGDERVVCVSPVGYPAKRRTMLDSMMRGIAGSARRKPWSELFFDGALNNPMSEQAAGEFKGALDAVRLAPSGTNGQPWRIVRQESRFHFYRAAKPDSDYGRVDMGIAACHFELVAREQGHKGEWVSADPGRRPDVDMVYFITWDQDL
jgi:nitroreductase